MRVLPDANVLISYLLPSSHETAITAIMEAVFAEDITLLVSDDLLQEMVESIKTKPRLAKRITPQEADDLASSLQQISEILPPLPENIPAVSRDPKDDYLLAHALLGSADYLVTGDKGLLNLAERVEGLKIVEPVEFVRDLRRG